MRLTRRRALRRFGSVVTMSGALAGCTELGEQIGANDTEGTILGSSPADEPASIPWLFAPSAIGLDDYAFVQIRPKAIGDHEAHLSSDLDRRVTQELELPGFGGESMRSCSRLTMVANAVTVLEGPFDRERAAEETNLDPVAEPGDFDIYAVSEQRAWGVSSSAYVQSTLRGTSIDRDAETLVTEAIDAGEGATDRYQDVNDDCARLLSELGDAEALGGRTVSPDLQSVDGAVAEGGCWRFDGARTDVTLTVVFETEAAVDTEAVQEWASAGPPYGAVEPTVAEDGRVVTTHGERPTDEIADFEVGWNDPGPERDIPMANFAFDYDHAAGTVTITHDGGDTIPASDLFVRGNGFAGVDGADQVEPGPWQGTVSGDGTVVPGDHVIVGVVREYEIRLDYEGGEQSTTLAMDEGPDA